MTELIERTEVQAPLPAPQVNTPPEDASTSLKNALRELRQRLLVETAGVSSAIAEASAAWPHVEFGETARPHARDWRVLGAALAPNIWHATFTEPAEVTWGDLGLHPHRAQFTGALSVLEDALLAGAVRTAPLRATAELLPLRFGPVNVDPLRTHQRARRRVAESRELALDEIRRRLDAAKSTYARMAPRDVVRYVTEELGIGQLVAARAVGVSPTAVRKWRRGETARSEHRDQLCRFAAFAQLLSQMGPHDPAGWLDIPLSSASTLTPMDLFTSGRADLALLHASGLAEPHETLDAFDLDWRTRHPVDPEYEVVTLKDGSRAVLPRRWE